MKEGLPRRGFIKLLGLTAGTIAAEQLVRGVDTAYAATRSMISLRSRRDCPSGTIPNANHFPLSDACITNPFAEKTVSPGKKETPISTVSTKPNQAEPSDFLTGVGCCVGGLSVVGAAIAIGLYSARQAKKNL